MERTVLQDFLSQARIEASIHVSKSFSRLQLPTELVVKNSSVHSYMYYFIY